MDEQKKKQIDRMFFRLSMLPLIGAVGYMFFSAITKKELGGSYYVVLGMGLLMHWLLSDVLSVVCSRGFEGKTDLQKKAYRIYSLLNLVGFAGLGFFACSVGNNKGIYGALVYVMTLSFKRKHLETYRKTPQEETEDSQEGETEEASEDVCSPEETFPEASEESGKDEK